MQPAQINKDFRSFFKTCANPRYCLYCLSAVCIHSGDKGKYCSDKNKKTFAIKIK